MSFFKPKTPTVQPPPVVVAEAPAIPTQADPAIKKVRQNVRQRAAASGGNKSTIATSAQGLTTTAPTTKKSLLGG